MSDIRKKMKLTSYKDIFENEESRKEEHLERIQIIPIAEMDDFPNHPFHVCDDEKMKIPLKVYGKTVCLSLLLSGRERIDAMKSYQGTDGCMPVECLTSQRSRQSCGI